MGKTRKIKLGDIVLPVNPVELEVITPQLNKRLTLLNMGTVNLKGNRDVATATISSFFPSQESPFYRYADMPPKKYRAKIENWKENKETKRLIITDMGVNLAMLIDKCSFKVKEGGGDMYYTLELSEYRNLTVPTVSIPLQVRDNGLKQRPDEAVPARRGATSTAPSKNSPGSRWRRCGRTPLLKRTSPECSWACPAKFPSTSPTWRSPTWSPPPRPITSASPWRGPSPGRAPTRPPRTPTSWPSWA